MKKTLGRVFFVVALLGFLGALGWSGYLYYTIWTLKDQVAHGELENLRGPFQTALSQDDGWQNPAIPPLLQDSLKSLAQFRFLSLSTPEGKVAHLVASPGYKLPADLAQRRFPGFTTIPYVQNSPKITFHVNGKTYTLAGWKDPLWTTQELLTWYYPGIVLGATFIFSVLSMIVLALLKPNRITSDTPPNTQMLESELTDVPDDEDFDHVPEHLPPLKIQTLTGSQSRLFNENGFVWHDIFLVRLGTELDRSAAENQDLTVVLFRVEGDAGWEGTVVSSIATLTPYRDLLFECDQGFCVILPRLKLERAFEDTQEFVKLLKMKNPSHKFKVGLSSRSGRLLSTENLLKEAEEALSKAGAGSDYIVGFHADPQLYREFVSSQEKMG